jgi:cob(I)alamin adenosyltransferase
MKTKIYTKVGDKGQTSLIGGERVSKADLRLSTYGTIDELNAGLGMALALVRANYQLRSVASVLEKNQHLLFTVGSHLACANEKLRPKLPQLPKDLTSHLEMAIDQAEEHLPELKNFILPGGAPAAAHLHLARTVCRRAERELVHFLKTKKKMPEIYAEILRYLNRLGDYLFIAARFVNMEQKSPETIWVKPE